MQEIPFSTTISFAASGSMPTQSVTGALSFTADNTGARDGNQVLVDLLANGVHIPTFSGFRQWDGSTSWANTLNVRNCLTFFRRGQASWYTINQQAGAPTEEIAATGLTLAGPSSGLNSVASTSFTVSANGTLSSSVTVSLSDSANGGSFSPTSIALSSGTTSATFLYTPASTGAKSISITNDGALTNPSALTYTSLAAPVVPDAPTSLAAGTVTSSSVPLSWSAPIGTGGAAITDYVVQYSLAGANSWTTFADGTSTTSATTVTGLTAATSYDFRVAAVNSAGTGAYSSTTTVITGVSSPTAVIVTLQNTNALTESPTATWTASGASYSSRGNAGTLGLAGDGWVGMDFVSASDGIQMVTLDAVQGRTDYTTCDFVLWIYSDGIYSMENNASIVKRDTDATGSATKRYRLRRAGSTIYLERSIDSGSNWTTLHTFGTTSSATLYPVWFAAASGVRIINPRALGLA